MKCIKTPTGKTAECRQPRARGWTERGTKLGWVALDLYIPSGIWISELRFCFWFKMTTLLFLKSDQKSHRICQSSHPRTATIREVRDHVPVASYKSCYLQLVTCDYLRLWKESSVLEKARTSKSNRLMFKNLLYLHELCNLRPTN